MFQGGVTLKALSLAAVAGCVSVGTEACGADVPSPVLDTFHDSSTFIPNTDMLYPSSEYTLTEFIPQDENNLPLNVIKYYDPNNLDNSIHYLEIGLKHTEYGEGSIAKYFKWSKVGDIVKLVETSVQSEAVLTIRYDDQSLSDKIYADTGVPISSVSELYVGRDITGIIGSKSRIESVTSKFIGNTLNVEDSSDYNYSSIYTESVGEIGTVSSSFVGNTITVEDGLVHGTLVKSLGTIDSVTSEFIGNNVVSSGSIFGGLVESASSGSIGRMTSDFLRNTTTTDSTSIRGSLVRNDGTMSIVGSKFIDNAGVSNSGLVYGVIENSATTNGKGLVVNDTVFTGNRVISTSSEAFGGAIENTGILRIENSIFRGNSAESNRGLAHGGAIYSKSDFTISANSGKTTEFSDNYTLNGSTRVNEAIYVDSDLATLTLSATDNGRILLNDVINGKSGYNVLLSGDSSGRISLYNSILNADVIAQSVNIDMQDGLYKTYDFLSLRTSDSAKYSIDINFSTNSSDKFTLGSGSSGVIYLDDLRISGGLPTVSGMLQLLTGPDTISIELTQNAIDKYFKVTEREYSTSDNLRSSVTWGEVFSAHNYKEITTEGIRTAVIGSDRTSADGLEYYIEKEVVELGSTAHDDTLMLMNQSTEFAEKTFRAPSRTTSYTVTSDMGKTYGTLNVNGYNSTSYNVIDVSNHRLFEIGEGSSVNLNNLTINNLADVDGSLMDISAGGSGSLNNVKINGNENTAAIINNGTLTLGGGRYYTSNALTGGGIKGSGTTNITGYWKFNQGTALVQDVININKDGYLYIYADDLKGTTNLNHKYAYLYLTGGTLNSIIQGVESSTTSIKGDTILNADVLTEIYINSGNTLTTTAEHIKNDVSGSGTLKIMGGTITSEIRNSILEIMQGNIIVADGGNIRSKNVLIHDGASFTVSADAIYENSYYDTITNDGIFNIVNGTLETKLDGSGTTNIKGDTTVDDNIISQNRLYIEEGATLHVNGTGLGKGSISDFVNDGILELNAGTFNAGSISAINGDGKTIVGGRVIAYNTDFNQETEISENGILYLTLSKLNVDILKNNGLLYFDGKESSSAQQTLSHNISGTGTTYFGYSYSKNIKNEAVIATRIYIGANSKVYSNADLIRGDISAKGGIHLTGGTLNHKVSSSIIYQGTGVFIEEGSNVIGNAIMATGIMLYNDSTLTISADNVDCHEATDGWINLYSGSNLKLTSGTFSSKVEEPSYYSKPGEKGKITILSGNRVTHTGNSISVPVYVENNAEFLASATNLVGDIINNGKLYLSGLLTRKYSGPGTTYIDKTLSVGEGAGFPATFDLNNGTLISSSINSYNFGHTTNNGNLIFNIDVLDNSADNFTLASTSDAVFNISDINFSNYNNISYANTSHIFQILDGNSKSKLQLSDFVSKNLELHFEEQDTINVNAYFDDIYNKHHKTGVISATIELATTQTANDSVKITYGEVQWNPDYDTKLDLLSDWGKISTSEVRNFNFKTSEDVYTTIQDLGQTTAGTLNINGISTTTTDADGNTVVNRSVIDFAGFNGFDMSDSKVSNVMNIENVEFRNGKDYYIKAENDTFGTQLEDGTIQGGIINCLFKDLDGNSSAIYLDYGTILYQIKDSLFLNNKNSNSGIIRNASGSTIYEIVNTVFENNSAWSAIVFNGGTINSIRNVTFKNNSSTALYSSGGINEIIDSSFISSDGYGLYISSKLGTISGTLFEGNSKNAIYAYCSIIDEIVNSTFKSNTGHYGGAIYGYGTKINKISGTTFENNISTTDSFNQGGGAIYNLYNLGEISNCIFRGNTALESNSGGGGAIMNSYLYVNSSTIYQGNINLIKDSIFENNLASKGGAISIYEAVINEIINSTFIGNNATQGGGAIYNDEGEIKNIVNSLFKDNSAKTGGAIYNMQGTIKISAKDGGITEFTGNYAGSSYSAENNVAIYNYYYSGQNTSTLTLNAESNGTILMNDKIVSKMYNDYVKDKIKVILTGDSSGTIKLFDTVTGGDITAENVNINTANGKIQDYKFDKFTSSDSAKWTIDIDFANKTADKFTVGQGTGIMYVDDLNVVNNANKYTKVQVLKKAYDNVTVDDADVATTRLVLKNAVIDIRDTLGDTVYNNETYHQEAGFAVVSSKTWDRAGFLHDEISQCVDEDLDALNLIVSSTKNQVRNFVFRDGSTYEVKDNLEHFYSGTINIKGVEGSTSTIDAKGHNLFRFDSSNTTLNLSDVKLTGTDTLVFGSGKLNISGNETILDGYIGFAVNTTLNSGDLRFNTNTFSYYYNELTLNAGTLALDNGSVENYSFENLKSVADAQVSIDIDVTQKNSDKMNLSNGSGVITLANVNFINTTENNENFVTQVIKGGSLQLALTDEVKHQVLKEYTRIINDEVTQDTNFNTTFNSWSQSGTLLGDIYLTTTNTTNDSIEVDIRTEWADDKTFINSLGDTFDLVNRSELGIRNFNSQSSEDVYNISLDLSETAAGTLNINGTLSDDGSRSTINFNNHNALQLGSDTTLSVNNTRLTGARELIKVNSSGSKVILNNAYINGSIVGNSKFDIIIDGLDTTTIMGNLSNADVEFKNGGLIIGENTFANTNTTFNVKDYATVYLNDGDVSNYNISNMTSSILSKYGLDIDLKNRTADTITAEGSGRIVLEKFDILNNLANVDINDNYTIQILKTSNDALQLEISETVKSQLNDNYKLGTVHEIIRTDVINPTSNWVDKYYQDEADFDIFGKLKLSTSETINDSLHLYELRKVKGEERHVLGDTLKLLSNLVTETDRRFVTDKVSTYILQDDIGAVTSGNISLEGVSGSVIDMNNHKGFQLSNGTQLSVSNVQFENSGYKDGSLVNITNKDAVLNLTGVVITDTASTNAIKNAGTLNVLGGNNDLYSGITGTGVINITGGNVVLHEGLSITQEELNILGGVLSVTSDSELFANVIIGSGGELHVNNANALNSSVVNDGTITITKGTSKQNITGSGLVRILEQVNNEGLISQDVQVDNGGELTTSADNIGGVIHNSGILNLTGTLDNVVEDNGITNVDKSLTLTAGAGIEGTLNLNDGAISTAGGKTSNYSIGTMLETGSFNIDVDLSAKSSDKFIVGNKSSGTVYLDSINFAGSLGQNESLKVQILDTNGTDAIQLALNEELTNSSFVVGTVTSTHNDLRSSVYFDEKFSDYEVTGTIYANLKLATTSTTNDSIELEYTETIWGDETSTQRLDTLHQLVNYKSDEDKNFNFRTSSNKFTVVEDLGEAASGVLNINGVADGDKRSEINLGNKSGFELTNDTTLNIKDVEIGYGKNEDIIIATNSDAVVNLENTKFSGNISGSGTAINITGEVSDTTTLDGTITNSDTTLSGGTLKFNTDTFGDSRDTLTVEGGRVDVQDSKVSTYDVNKLTSSQDGKFSIDVDLSAQKSDKFSISDDSSSGTIYIDNINYMNGELPSEFIVQVLDTNGNDKIQIKLSDEIKNSIYDFGTTERNWDDLKSEVDFDEYFHDYHQDGELKGSIKEATTETTNDSISLKVDAPIWGETTSTVRKDTLHEIAEYNTDNDKSFNFKTSKDEYISKADVGTINGTLNVNGVFDGEVRSEINLSNNSGFELKSDSELNLRDVEVLNGENNTTIISRQPDSVVNLENTIISGNISGNDTHINITGEQTDTTTLGGVITDSDTTLSGGSLKFNTDTFADSGDSLTVDGGRVDVQDSKTSTYDINKLTSSENGKFSIDVDLSGQTSDKFTLSDTNSSGTVYIDEINYINGDLPTEFTVQVLDTNGNENVQIKLSDEIKDKIYDFGMTEKNWDDMSADVDFDQIIHDFHKEGTVKGSITEATTATTNDSISLKMDEPIWGETTTTERLDTLHEISAFEIDKSKTFNFKSSSEVYESKTDVGSVNGTLAINGVEEDDKLSTIDLNEHKGFELIKGSKLTINKTLLKNGSENTLITANDESGEVTLRDSQVDGAIKGVDGYTVNITGSSGHVFDVRNDIQNAKINIDTVQLDFYDTQAFSTSDVRIRSGLVNLTVDNKISDLSSKSFEVTGNFGMLADADLANRVMDKLPSNTQVLNNASINVAGINLLSDTNSSSVSIPFAYKGFKDNVKYRGFSVLSKSTQITSAFAPIYKYDVRYENRDDMGYFVFSRAGANGGNSSSQYNPAILASPVTTQAVGQSTMNETFRYVFEHADAFTQLPSTDRLSIIKANQYALSTDFNHNLGSLCAEHNNKAGWYRPYSTFESINLSNGPKVNTISYGSIAGYDSDFRELKNGWVNVGTGYIGYNGSQVHYSGVDTTMNGGLLGITETFYKGNFWTALTASAGAGVAETRTMYGKEDSTMLMAGIGSKTGYNLEFEKGKYILQPIMFMSYTFVNTFDYTNAAGVRIENDPMHTIQLNPSVRFIANLSGGWQPYASVGMVWNLMNESHSSANGVKLPEMHTKPYVEYGVGLQKNIKDRFTAYGQAMLRNGGRTGISLTAGFRWALGHEQVQNHNHSHDKVQLEVPNDSRTTHAHKTILKQLSPAQKAALTGKKNTTITSSGAVIKEL